jgi:hypothetical protein
MFTFIALIVGLLAITLLCGMRTARSPARASPVFPKRLPMLALIILIVGTLAMTQLCRMRPVRAKAAKTVLDAVLLRWTPHDPFTMRDLLNGGVAIVGRAGSGKTSGSGRKLADAIVGNRRTGGLILASAPTDLGMWQEIFARAGRQKDLILFGPGHRHQFNVIDYQVRQKADARDIAKAIICIGEALDNDDSRSGGGEGDKFWPIQVKRTLETSIEIVRQALGRVTIPEIQRFINTAALSPEQLTDPKWADSFHNQCFRRAYGRAKSGIEQHDYQLANDFWLCEWPGMNDRTRSSIQAGVLGPLHVFNQGIVRSLLSEGTTITPEIVEKGKWIFVDMPIGQHGSSGAFVLSSLKYFTQRHILRRTIRPDNNPIIIWCDEAQKVVNSADSFFLSESRKYAGCSIYLTQSMHAYFAALSGERGKNQAETLLTNFATKVFHAVGDPKTAEWASKLVGSSLQTFIGGSMQSGTDDYDALTGKLQFSSNFNQKFEPILQPNIYMHGMRTGGPANRFMVDGIVVRNGEPFSNGENWLWCTFSQK